MKAKLNSAKRLRNITIHNNTNNLKYYSQASFLGVYCSMLLRKKKTIRSHRSFQKVNINTLLIHGTKREKEN